MRPRLRSEEDSKAGYFFNGAAEDDHGGKHDGTAGDDCLAPAGDHHCAYDEHGRSTAANARHHRGGDTDSARAGHDRQALLPRDGAVGLPV